MMSVRKFIIAIKKQETPFYAFLFRCAKIVLEFSMPTIKPFHSFLYNEWTTRTSLWHNFWRIFYYEPMFKSQCQSVGKNFKMEYAGNGTSRIFGNLMINIGSGVTVFDNTCFVGLRITDKPELSIGNNSYIAPNVRMIVGKKISIGNHCLIGSRLIADNQGHPFYDVVARMMPGGGSPALETIKPITIGDFCLLTLDTVVYPGVTIGDGVVATIGTHISRDVPPFCLVTGFPMKITKKLPIPEQLIEIVGEERYSAYLDAHKHLTLD